jgi:hypothetical protein
MKTGTYHHTEETLEKIKESNRRRTISPETRLKMKQSAIGKHPKDGEQNPCWKGGRKIRQDGYILVRLYPGDQFYGLANKSGYAMEHRLVMARYLGRFIQPFPLEVINHKNGIKDDNRIENLEIKSQSEHLQEHTLGYQKGYRQGYLDGQNQEIEDLRKEVKLLRWQLKESGVLNG